MKTILINFMGQRWLLSELATITGVPKATLRKRLVDGWTLEQALGTPTPKQRRAGVVSNLSAFKGTGARGTSQDTQNIVFQDEA